MPIVDGGTAFSTYDGTDTGIPAAQLDGPVTCSIGSLLLGDITSDYATAGFYLVDLGDWDAISDSKSDLRERAQADGADNIANDFRTSLPFTIAGMFVGTTRAEVQAAKRVLSMAAGQGKPVQVIVTDSDGAMRRTASVRRITPDPGYSGFSYGFTIDLVAPDPLKYGPDVILTTTPAVSGVGLWWPLGTRRTDSVVDASVPYFDWGPDSSLGRVEFTNDGTAPTWPAIQVAGGLSGGFTATDVVTGQIIRFERVIPDGSFVRVNQRTGRAWLDAPGNDVSGQITSRDFFSIGPGETHQIQFAPIGVVTGSPSFSLIAAEANR